MSMLLQPKTKLMLAILMALPVMVQAEGVPGSAGTPISKPMAQAAAVTPAPSGVVAPPAPPVAPVSAQAAGEAPSVATPVKADAQAIEAPVKKPAPSKPKSKRSAKKKPVADAAESVASLESVEGADTEGKEKAPAKKVDPYQSIELVQVSDTDYNRFVFATPVVRIDFPAGSPVQGEPVYLNGNREALLQFMPGAKRVIQVVATQASGKVSMLYLKPVSGPGAVVRVDGAEDADMARIAAVKAMSKDGSAEDAAAKAGANTGAAQLIERVAMGDIPAGYDVDDMRSAAPTLFDKFTAVPVMTYTNHVDRKISVFDLMAFQGETVVVAPPQFYREGVLSVMLDKEQLDDTGPVRLYVVEALTDGIE